MALPTVSYTYDNLATTTLQLVRRRMADAIFKANPTSAYFLMRGRVRTESGGKWIEEPVLYNKNLTVQAYKGYERLNVNPTEELTMARFTWRQAAVSIAISGIEELQNAGPSAIIKLLSTKIEVAEHSLREWLDEKIHAATSTKDLTRDFLGLDESIESAATQGTYGGIDASGSGYSWWRNQQRGNAGAPIDLTTSLTLLNDSLIRLYNDCSKGLATPDLIISPQELYERYEKDNRQYLQLRDTNLLDIGFMNQKFKRATWMWNENCRKTSATAGQHLYMINTDYLGIVLHTARNFKMSSFVSPYDQDARIAQILIAGNMTGNNRRFQGVGVFNNV